MGLKLHQKDYRRWLIWGVLCLAYITSVSHRMGMGVIRADLEDTFNMSAMAFAALGSVYFYVYMVMQIPAGMLLDSLGVRTTAAAGLVLAGAGSVLFGLSPTISLAFIARFLIALGVSVLFISILKIQSSWFQEREFGMLSGFAVLFENMGAILAQTPLVALVALLTWRYSFVLVGVAGVMIAGICFLLVRNKPSDIGLPPPSDCEMEKNKTKNVMKALLQVIKNPYTWPVSISYAGVNGSLMALTGTWGQSYFMEVYGMGGMKAAGYNTIILLGGAIAGLSIGWISDKVRKRKAPMIIMGIVYMLSWAVLVLIYGGKPPVAVLGALIFVMGLSSSSFVLAWACGKEVNNPEYAGISTAFVNSMGFLGIAIIPLVFGWILDRYANVMGSQQLYNSAFICCLVGAVVGCISMFFVKETNCRNISKDINLSAGL